MKRFPFSRLKLKTGTIGASLWYNPYSNLPPTVWHSITAEIEPLHLAADAAMPEYEKVVDSTIIFDGLCIDGRSWNTLDGSYSFDDDQNGTFYVSSAHNPVDVRRLNLQYRGGINYDVDATATFHFEFEGSGYADESTRLVFPVVHRGFSFNVPRWVHPEEIELPADWGIPSTSDKWPSEVIRSFVERYYDLSQFQDVTVEEDGLSARPIE